jgi:flagellar hook-associated protein 1 FlgK
VSQLNGLFNGKLQFSNTGSVIRVLDNGAVGTTAVNAASVRRTETSLTGGGPEVPLFTDANTPYSGAISATGSQRIGFAGRITVNQSILADPTKLVVYQAGTSAGDPTRPNFLYEQLVNGTFDYSPSTGVGTVQAPFSGRIGSYLRQVLSQQGEAAKNADSIKQGQDVVLNSLQQRFNDASGVSVDQEMANLLNLQNAYGASARIMTTVRDMFQTLLQVIQ